MCIFSSCDPQRKVNAEPWQSLKMLRWFKYLIWKKSTTEEETDFDNHRWRERFWYVHTWLSVANSLYKVECVDLWHGHLGDGEKTLPCITDFCICVAWPVMSHPPCIAYFLLVCCRLNKVFTRNQMSQLFVRNYQRNLLCKSFIFIPILYTLDVKCCLGICFRDKMAIKWTKAAIS